MAFRKGKRDGERGAAMVEFALVALLLSILDLALVAWVDLTMQHSVREGARYAITGNADLDNDGDRKKAVINKIRESSLELYDDICDEITPDFGEGGDIIVVSLDCEWRLLTPMIRSVFEYRDRVNRREAGSRHGLRDGRHRLDEGNADRWGRGKLYG